jgi:hypothetical protein
VRMLPFAGLLLGSFVSAASAEPLAQPSAGPAEPTERQMDGVTAGAGKVSMNDFHFVMRNNSSSPGLLAGTGKPDPTPTPK